MQPKQPLTLDGHLRIGSARMHKDLTHHRKDAGRMLACFVYKNCINKGKKGFLCKENDK